MRYNGILVSVCLSLGLSITTLFAQGTAFTYQGKLQQSGGPANGSYDLVFTPFGVNTGGIALTTPVTNSATSVSNGLFTVMIDFGPGIFTGPSNWLEIAVRTNGAGSFTTLTPRQFLAPVPYAMYANTAGNLSGAILNSSLPANPSFSGAVTASSFQSTTNGSFIAGTSNSATGLYDTSGGGNSNTVIGNYATISGGRANKAQGVGAVIAGGGYDGATVAGNVASGNASAIGGGNANTASGLLSVVSGGNNNAATNSFAMIPGGQFNTAGGTHSFAAGRKAQALHSGSFVWADETDAYFSTSTNNEFLVRAANGVGINTNNPNGMALNVNGPVSVNGAINATTLGVNTVNTLIASTINLNATGTVSAQNVLLGATGNPAVASAGNNSIMVYGTVNADGTIASGSSDFTVSHNTGSGFYQITFTNAPFAAPPVVTASISSSAGGFSLAAFNQVPSGFVVEVYGYPGSANFNVDSAFSFIAIGARMP